MEKYSYKQLIVWEKADELAYRVYLVTRKFPREERYGMTSQLRRAALSVPTNIVEGVGRQGKAYLRQFTNIALGSVSETEYLLDFCLKFNYLDAENHFSLQSLRKEVGSLLWRFYKSI